jgi:hypothetical protein
MVIDAAPAAAVSGRVTLRRAATGAGLAVAATVLIGLAGHPAGDFVGVSVLIWSTCALYNGGDRHRRTACAAAAITAAVVWLGTLPVPGAGLPGNVGGALLGALAASQVYAVITRVGLAAAGSAPDQAR